MLRLCFAMLAVFSLAVTTAGCLGIPDPLPTRPVADAGPDRFAELDVPVVLDGSASTSPYDASLTYSWAFDVLPGSSALTQVDISPNDSPDAVKAEFTPDQPGRYVLRLLVQDPVTVSTGDYLVVDVEGSGPRPIAEAGEDQTVFEGMAVYFDGSSSHAPDGAALYYRWDLEGTPPLSAITPADLVNRYTPYPSLIVDAGGLFTLSLVASDGETESSPDYVFVTVVSNNSIPVANAGPDRLVPACTVVEVDGSESYDIDQDPLDYSWSLLVAPLYSEVDTDSLMPQGYPSTGFYVDQPGQYVLSLSVSDGDATSVPDVVHLTADPRENNSAPVVEVSGAAQLEDQVVCTGSGVNTYCPDCPAVTVVVSGEGTSDADGDTMSYLWSVEEGNADIQYPTRLSTSVELKSARAALGASFINVYRLSLEVTDCPGDETTAEVVIEYVCTGTN